VTEPVGERVGEQARESRPTPVRELLREAACRLAEGGVPSPEYDAAELLAHVLGTTRGQLPLVEPVTATHREEYAGLVGRRAAREPLQHLIGTTAFRHVELHVGPGEFVPRPETELVAGWAIGRAIDRAREAGGHPVVVDLCTGSGAIAASFATELPEARVHAVELDPGAFAWAERNLAGTGVDLRLGDMADAFPDLDGMVDVVVCNPPYIPLEAFESVAPEARDHDPALAQWSGDDGLDAMRVLEATAARLLRPRGWVGAEHADAQGETARQVFLDTGRWADVRDHEDLAGRSRYVVARLAR
jgi:release factor glutamine methyltransferase